MYNGERFLGAAIDSILTQTHEDLELVISDNASTDGTEAICRAAVAADARVVYERQPENRGAAWNYNRTFALSHSPFFRWAAADDLLAPTCIERCHAVLSTAPPSVVMVYPRTLIVDERAQPVGDWEDGLDLRSPSPAKRFNQVVRNVVLGNVIFGLVRSDAVARTRGHGSFPSADWVYLSELALLGEIWELPERLFLRRMHGMTSRAAHPDVADLSRWLDPEATPVEDEKQRLLREFVRAIRRAELPLGERVATLARFAVVWSRRHSRWYARLARARRG